MCWARIIILCKRSYAPCMAYLNYTAQDFASSLENRRPGVLPNPYYAKQLMHQVNNFLFIFSNAELLYLHFA